MQHGSFLYVSTLNRAVELDALLHPPSVLVALVMTQRVMTNAETLDLLDCRPAWRDRLFVRLYRMCGASSADVSPVAVLT